MPCFKNVVNHFGYELGLVDALHVPEIKTCRSRCSTCKVWFCFQFMDMFPPSDEGIVDEKAELDKERVRYIFLAMLLNLGEGGLPEPSGLQNMVSYFMFVSNLNIKSTDVTPYSIVNFGKIFSG